MPPASAHSPMQKMCGSLVRERRCRRRCRRARRPRGRRRAPARRAGGCRRRRSPCRPAARRRRARRSASHAARVADDRLGLRADVHAARRARSIDWRRTAPPPPSTCRGIRRGANSTTWVSSPRSRTALAASSPSRPPPMTAARRAPRRPGADRVEVLDRAVDEDARQLDAGQRRHERRRAGGEHQRVVGHARPAAVLDRARGAIDRDDALAEVQRRCRARRTRRRRRAADRSAVRAGEELAQVDAVVGGPRLLAEARRRASGARRRTLDQALAEAMADHAVADDHQRAAVRAARSCCGIMIAYPFDCRRKWARRRVNLVRGNASGMPARTDGAEPRAALSRVMRAASASSALPRKRASRDHHDERSRRSHGTDAWSNTCSRPSSCGSSRPSSTSVASPARASARAEPASHQPAGACSRGGGRRPAAGARRQDHPPHTGWRRAAAMRTASARAHRRRRAHAVRACPRPCRGDAHRHARGAVQLPAAAHPDRARAALSEDRRARRERTHGRDARSPRQRRARPGAPAAARGQRTPPRGRRRDATSWWRSCRRPIRGRGYPGSAHASSRISALGPLRSRQPDHGPHTRLPPRRRECFRTSPSRSITSKR